eukprot:scaffold97046_cov32-Phaeocystis_antarctica.AAC.1
MRNLAFFSFTPKQREVPRQLEALKQRGSLGQRNPAQVRCERRRRALYLARRAAACSGLNADCRPRLLLHHVSPHGQRQVNDDGIVVKELGVHLRLRRAAPVRLRGVEDADGGARAEAVRAAARRQQEEPVDLLLLGGDAARRQTVLDLLKVGTARHLGKLAPAFRAHTEVEVAADGYGRACTRRECPGELKKGAGPLDLVVHTHPSPSNILVHAVVAQEEAGARSA